MGQKREIPLPFHGLRIRSIKQCDRLIWQKPIADSHPDLLHAFHSPYSGS
jgi:hypothetical protein